MFNTFCDAGISSCPIDGPHNIEPADEGHLSLKQHAKHTGQEDFFANSWVATTASGEKSLVFVVPDGSVIEIFDNPDFCSTGACLMPVGLLEQEIRVNKPVLPE